MPFVRSRSSECSRRPWRLPFGEGPPSEPLFAPDKATLGAKVFFRGRILGQAYGKLCLSTRTPDVRIVRVPSASSGIVVTSSGDEPVSILTEPSPSSWMPQGAWGARRRSAGEIQYAEAVDALQRVLSRLPEGTRSPFGSSDMPWETVWTVHARVRPLRAHPVSWRG